MSGGLLQLPIKGTLDDNWGCRLHPVYRVFPRDKSPGASARGGISKQPLQLTHSTHSPNRPGQETCGSREMVRNGRAHVTCSAAGKTQSSDGEGSSRSAETWPVACTGHSGIWSLLATAAAMTGLLAATHSTGSWRLPSGRDAGRRLLPHDVRDLLQTLENALVLDHNVAGLRPGGRGRLVISWRSRTKRGWGRKRGFGEGGGGGGLGK